MDKTLNQEIYEIPTDVKTTIYNRGYENGVACGKLCAAQQILDELEELLTKKKEECRQMAASHPEIEYPEADVYWTGRSVSCFDILQCITVFKKKYEVL